MSQQLLQAAHQYLQMSLQCFRAKYPMPIWPHKRQNQRWVRMQSSWQHPEPQVRIIHLQRPHSLVSKEAIQTRSYRPSLSLKRRKTSCSSMPQWVINSLQPKLRAHFKAKITQSQPHKALFLEARHESLSLKIQWAPTDRQYNLESQHNLHKQHKKQIWSLLKSRVVI